MTIASKILNNVYASTDGTGVIVKAAASLTELRTKDFNEAFGVIYVLDTISIPVNLSLFFWDTLSVLADNNTTVIKPISIDTGRWIKQALNTSSNSTPALLQGTSFSLLKASGIFKVPTGVTTITVTAQAGGGGGGAGGSGGKDDVGLEYFGAGGGGGGAGESIYKKDYTVIPGANLSVQIGGGGPGGITVNHIAGSGMDGGATSINALSLYLSGGGAGVGGAKNVAATNSVTSGGAGGLGYPSGSWGQDTGYKFPPGCGGLGGSGLFGGGGAYSRGGKSSPGATTSAPGGDGYTYGSGGGGGGGIYDASLLTFGNWTSGGNGGAGTSGLVLIEW